MDEWKDDYQFDCDVSTSGSGGDDAGSEEGNG